MKKNRKARFFWFFLQQWKKEQKDHFSSDAPINTTKDELIVSLQEENKRLKTQVATLKEVMSKK